jgi:hypothetical protein
VYDIFLTVKYHDSILSLEQNPVAAWLITKRSAVVSRFVDKAGNEHVIEYYSVDVSVLVLLKTLGLLAAMTGLQTIMSRMKRKMALAIIGPLFVFQLLFLCYLLLG